jgi:tetratricopeptide (TPR) repeat protein
MTGLKRRHISGWLLFLGAVLWLWIGAGCGGARQTKAGAPDGDREFDRLSRMARSAFDNGQINQAIAGYEKALARAYVSDDLDAIVDTGYNLGVCHLRQEDFAAALETVETAVRELRAAGRTAPSDLRLLQAAALYYGGSPDRAWRVSQDILSALPAPSSEVLARTRYLRGRIAADRGDARQLRAEIAALVEPSLPGLAADRLELTGRLAMVEERWEDAVADLDQAARLRAENGNYRLMAATLAVSAQACDRGQRPEEGAYRYLRAARSSALSGDASRAAAWLSQAVRLAEQSSATSILTEARRFQDFLSGQ